jgi:hypothetical protein
MEVELVPEPFTGSLMGLMALAIRRRALAVEHGLEKGGLPAPSPTDGESRSRFFTDAAETLSCMEQ